jgi:hypothetical protein
MLKSYEAIYDHGHIQWLGEVPRFKRARVVLVADDVTGQDDATRLSALANQSMVATNTRLTANQADALLAETAGAWGNRSLAEVDALLAEQRSLDWGDE